ncbi:hypothetical protein [Flagellimonas lutimaris]|uniref:hypothetical protein n=1 Tax=Flagellimonas lutimaris TaxID=475082 RepID=UPI003F5CC28B
MKNYTHLIIGSALSLFMLFSCSKDNDAPKTEQIKLGLTVYEDDIEKGNTVTFRITANEEAVTDAEIYIDEQPITGLEHTFSDKGSYTVVAKKSGYTASDPVTVNVYQTDIYAAGHEYSSSRSTYIAKYWKNGKAVLLSDGAQNEYALSIFVTDDSDVYICGRAVDIARYWTNNAPVDLPTSTTAQAIKVYNNRVYIVGREWNGSTHFAKLWTDGNVTTLNNGLGFSVASDVFINENDVYVSGKQDNGNFYQPVYWKNGILQILGNGITFGSAESIYVVEDDVYVAGNEFNGSTNVAKYWKNGVPHILTNGSNSAIANDIFVDQTDVYVVGRETISPRSTAIVWKNDNREDLTNGNNDAIANSVYVMDGDVYVGGFEVINGLRVATYWKNGVPVRLSASDPANSTEVTSIFIKKQY